MDKASGVVDALDDREFTGSLIPLLQNGLEFVFNNSKKQWKNISDSRIEIPDYPERSVQEGLVNALIHRDYLEIGSEVHIDMYDDRLEIYSPGGMHDGSFVKDRNVLRIPSKRRNPIIADAFNRLRLMDRRGSGFKKICSVPRSRAEIAERIEYKSKSTLWRIYLKPLILKGKLQMTIPEQPKNRNQKYVAVQ